jgi:L-amino acid N-acyltransferase YncA
VATFEETPRSRTDWESLAAELAGLGLPFLVASEGGVIAGYAYAGPWRRKPAYRTTAEDSIFVAPGHTGRGVGRLLLTELLSACETADVRQVIAVIADSSAAASVGLHESCGFARAGRLSAVGYKHGMWIDTLLLQRSIG